MLLPEFVEHVRCIEARIVAELPGDDFQSLGVCVDEQLRFSRNAPGIVAQMPADLHVDGATPGHDRRILDGPPHNHDGIVETALGLRNELHRNQREHEDNWRDDVTIRSMH